MIAWTYSRSCSGSNSSTNFESFGGIGAKSEPPVSVAAQDSGSGQPCTCDAGLQMFMQVKCENVRTFIKVKCNNVHMFIKVTCENVHMFTKVK